MLSRVIYCIMEDIFMLDTLFTRLFLGEILFLVLICIVMICRMH